MKCFSNLSSPHCPHCCMREPSQQSGRRAPVSSCASFRPFLTLPEPSFQTGALLVLSELRILWWHSGPGPVSPRRTLLTARPALCLSPLHHSIVRSEPVLWLPNTAVAPGRDRPPAAFCPWITFFANYYLSHVLAAPVTSRKCPKPPLS